MYRSVSVVLVGIIINVYSAKDIVFENKEILISKSNSSLAFIDTDECISPLYYDWDSDGDRDLLAGYWDGALGYLRFYENTGGDDFPTFSSWDHLKANGEDIAAKGG